MGRILFSNASLVDGTGAKPVVGVTIVIEGERILAVEKARNSSAPAESDTVYDLAGRTLMPGMVNGHAHLSYPDFDEEDLNSLDMARPPIQMAVLAAKNAETVLRAGFTAAAGAGSLHQIDRMLKDLIREGVIVGPRVMACGQDIIPTAGGMDLKPSWWRLGLSGLAMIVDGPDEVRKAVRLQAKEGNDFIKIYPQGGFGVPDRGPMDMQQDEIEAAVNTAHDKGKLVRAHVATKHAIMACLRAGVDVIDHGPGIDDEVCEIAVKQNVFFLPSLYMASIAPHYYVPRGDKTKTEERIAHWFERAAEKLSRAQAAGVKFVVGDDFGTSLAPHGHNGKELAVYVKRLGLDPLHVLSWATKNGAEMMRKDDQFGTIAPGKLADLLVVDGDPLANIELLGDPTNLSVVMQGGRFITNRLAPSCVA